MCKPDPSATALRLFCFFVFGFPEISLRVRFSFYPFQTFPLYLAAITISLLGDQSLPSPVATLVDTKARSALLFPLELALSSQDEALAKIRSAAANLLQNTTQSLRETAEVSKLLTLVNGEDTQRFVVESDDTRPPTSDMTFSAYALDPEMATLKPSDYVIHSEMESGTNSP